MGCVPELFSRKFKIKLTGVLILSCFLVFSGCASKPEPGDKAQLPQRQDLFDGQSILVGQSQTRPQSEQQALELAIKEEQAGRLDKALYLYIQALDFNPINAETFYKIAHIHTLRGRDDIAYRAYNEALTVDPNYMPAQAEFGIIKMSQREYTQARLHLEKAVSLDQQRLKEQRGLADNQTMIPLDQQSPLRVYNALGILEDLENHHDKARSYFGLALDYQPYSAVIATNLGYSYYLGGELSMAERYLKQAIQYDSSYERAWSNLGLVYIRTGQYSKALSTFEQNLSKADALNDLGYFLMLDGKYDRAITLFKQAIDASPSYFEQAQKNLKIAESELQLHSAPLASHTMQ
ncbi:tetratricopeptide repeat protein [Shewanella sedimentimangrovi]|uniref:Tetratricopeptide repeat protein n=1 Tax=Shewanella sedimentimangrovi TaxID=2814293 RepID=A0ABX7R1V1_9GAMM|nr:tetratricopeptide repeat protein [Shewanella sedimentimangrovi]QSX36816.1 tetratricopeptide repeat protein [Shewanella sedimentimangrovi]